MTANNAINADVQKRRFALLLHAGYGEGYASISFMEQSCLRKEKIPELSLAEITFRVSRLEIP